MDISTLLKSHVRDNSNGNPFAQQPQAVNACGKVNLALLDSDTADNGFFENAKLAYR